MTTICEHTITTRKKRKKEKKSWILFTKLIFTLITLCEDLNHNHKKYLVLKLNYCFTKHHNFLKTATTTQKETKKKEKRKKLYFFIGNHKPKKERKKKKTLFFCRQPQTPKKKSLFFVITNMFLWATTTRYLNFNFQFFKI